jgi:hypothetical protein
MPLAICQNSAWSNLAGSGDFGQTIRTPGQDRNLINISSCAKADLKDARTANSIATERRQELLRDRASCSNRAGALEVPHTDCELIGLRHSSPPPM